MKLKSIKNIAILIFAASSMVSCSDYLTESNPNLTTAMDFWQDLDDTQSGLTATYAALRDQYVLNIRQESIRCDMGWPGYGRPTPSNSENYMWYQQTYNNSFTGIISKWEALYTGVWRANQVYEGLEGIYDECKENEDDLAEWTYQMAQIRFLRGVFYFYLYSSFNEGSVVLKTHTSETLEDLNEPLAPAEDVLAFFRADLQYAYENLPYESPTTNDYVGIPAKGAAATILGTSYLYEFEYEEAEALFEEVIKNESYPYEIVTDLDLMFTTAGEFNSESIFEISYSTTERTDIGIWSDNAMTSPLATYSTNGGFYAPAWIVVAYNDERDMMDLSLDENFYTYPNDKGRVQRPVSLRAASMIALQQDDVTPYYIDGNATTNCNYGSVSHGFGKYKKYSNHDIVTSEVSATSGKNVTVNRLADVYLMYAECQLVLNGDAGVEEALNYINPIRRRWGLILLGHNPGNDDRTYNDVDYTAETLMAHLQDVERPLELSVEGHQIRWQDLKRWGKLENNTDNIFYQRAQVWYDAIQPSIANGYQFYNLDGSAITANQQYGMLELGDEYSDQTAGTCINYEYDDAAINYTVENNQYYPIPSTEVMNNSSVD